MMPFAVHVSLNRLIIYIDCCLRYSIIFGHYVNIDSILFISLVGIDYLIIRFMTVSKQHIAEERNKPLLSSLLLSVPFERSAWVRRPSREHPYIIDKQSHSN